MGSVSFSNHRAPCLLCHLLLLTTDAEDEHSSDHSHDYLFCTISQLGFGSIFLQASHPLSDVVSLQSLGQTGETPFSLHKKIIDYEEEKRKSCEDKNSNPFTPVRESKSQQRRSRKYRKLDMGHSAPSTATCTFLTTTITTTTATLSASAPTSLPALTPPQPTKHI